MDGHSTRIRRCRRIVIMNFKKFIRSPKILLESIIFLCPCDGLFRYTECNVKIEDKYLSKEIIVIITICIINKSMRALIGQSAVRYCADKPTEKIARRLNYCINATDHKFLWVIG